jgi:methylenetetrahydrofolate reductase (NADPH)
VTESRSPLPTLLRGCSIEVTSREPKTIDSCPAQLEKGSAVYLTWIPGDDPLKTVHAASVLRYGGLIPVPHIGARHLESETQLDQLLARFHGDAGVSQILLIAGDRDKPAGPYGSSIEVLDSGLLQKHGITEIGISGFPEGNPNIPDAAIAAALAYKRDWAKREGIALHIVSQFCFESTAILTWLRKLRGSGIDTPVRVGLAGPASIATLTRYALRCGVGNSVRALTRAPSLTRLLTDSSPEPIIKDLGAALDTEPALGIAGLHFFVFGGFNKTAQWLRNHAYA